MNDIRRVGGLIAGLFVLVVGAIAHGFNLLLFLSLLAPDIGYDAAMRLLRVSVIVATVAYICGFLLMKWSMSGGDD